MAMDEVRLQKQFDFLRQTDREKEISRQTYLASAVRKENDAEHAWHLALMTLLLNEYAEGEIDVLRTISMLLIHDLVEIDAGDTYAYDPERLNSQRNREEQAAEHIFGLLPDDQAQKLRALWEEFEAWDTPEAKFARTLDHIQPLMLNDASGGKSWVEHGISVAQVLRRNSRTAEGSNVLWDYARETMLLPHAGRELKTD